MRKPQKMLAVLLVFVFLFASIAGCSGQGAKNSAAAPSTESSAQDAGYGESSDYEMPAAEPAEYDRSVADENGYSSLNLSDIVQLEQKIIYNAHMEMETSDFDGALNAITARVQSLGGFVESTNIYGRKPEKYGDSGRNASLTVRVPSASLTDFLAAVKENATVISESMSTSNITQSYYDAQAHKESLELQLSRLESILTDSQTLADILALETEIARVRGDLESLMTTLKGWDNQVAYSTVTFYLQELTAFDRPIAESQTFGQRIAQAFKTAIANAGEGFKNFVVWFITALPTLVVLAVIAIALYYIIRAIVRSGERKRARQAEKRAVDAQNMQNKFGIPVNDDEDGKGEPK